MKLKNTTLELYYIEQKIKNNLINNDYSKWNTISIQFLLSIFSTKKYKKFHKICLLILSDYIKWFKINNNCLYNVSYYLTDLEYIYNLISDNLANKIITDIDYNNLLEQYITNDINDTNNKNKEIKNNYLNNSNYSNYCYLDGYINGNNFYILEIIFFIFLLVVLFLVKYCISYINKIQNIAFKKLNYNNGSLLSDNFLIPLESNNNNNKMSEIINSYFQHTSNKSNILPPESLSQVPDSAKINFFGFSLPESKKEHTVYDTIPDKMKSLFNNFFEQFPTKDLEEKMKENNSNETTKKIFSESNENNEENIFSNILVDKIKIFLDNNNLINNNNDINNIDNNEFLKIDSKKLFPDFAYFLPLIKNFLS